MIEIHVAETDGDIERCYAVMSQLRPHIRQDAFVARVKAQTADGYRLAYAIDDGQVAAVAGFRLGSNLAWGKFMYVDDLVTDQNMRSRGYGKALLAWLADEARRLGCAELHLDSGAQRKDAHRFYAREGLPITSYHFSRQL